MRNENIKFNDIFWNTIGTCTYASISLLLSVVVINLSGRIEGGIFSFGFSTIAKIAFTVTFFGIRPMHIVDIKYNYSFDDYLKFGIKMATIALFAGTLYIYYMYVTGTYAIAKVLLLVTLLFHGILDGISDYYECEFQRSNRLSIAGQNLFFRISIFAVTMIVVLIFTSNLLLAEVLAIVAELIAFFYLNIKRSKDVFKTIKTTNQHKESILFRAAPLFLITFLDICIFSLAKFFIDSKLGDVHSGFFGLVFMPTNAIYLLMTLFMRPMLTPLSNAYYIKKEEYNKILFYALAFALATCIVAIVVSLFAGKLYLSIVYILTGNNYPEFSDIAFKLFMVLIFGGCFYTLCTPLFYALIIESRQSLLLIVYVFVGIISCFIMNHMVTYFGLMGAAYGFLICMFLIFLGIVVAKVLSSLFNG